MVSLRPRALRVSSADQPLMSRRAITSRWRTGSSGDRLQQHLARFLRAQALLGRAPLGGRARPVAGMRIAERLEAVGVDRGLVATLVAPTLQERERQHAALALAPGARLVEQDAGDPGPQRGAALEAIDPVQDREPGVLNDLLGDRPAGHVHEGEPHQKRAVLVDQRPERVLVAASQSGDQLVVVRPPGRSVGLTARRGFLLPHRWRFSHACSGGRRRRLHRVPGQGRNITHKLGVFACLL